MNQYTDPTQHLFWLSSRALGIVAVVLLALTVSLGLLMSSRALNKRGFAKQLKNHHEAIALASVAAIAAHGLVLLGDKFLHPGLAGITLPFAMADQPVWTGVGIIAGWLTAIFTFSFYVRKWIGTKTWRWLHRWTLLAYVMAVVHTIGSGTDGRSTWMLVLLAAITAPVVFGLGLRFTPTQRKKAPAPQRTPVTT